MAAISKQEYLKRYLSNAEDEKKKKKRKKPKTSAKCIRSVIVDDDVGLDVLKPSKETQNNDELQAADEAPAVFDADGVTAISAESFKKREEDKKTKWAPVSALQEVPFESSFRNDNDISPPRKRRHDSPDLSPRRDSGKKQKFRTSPVRRIRHDSSDSSPPRRTKPNIKNERHEKHSQKMRAPSSSPPSPDPSPPRKLRHDSPDVSPPRRRQQRNEAMDSSPQSRKRHDSPDLSPFRNQHQDSPDNSPPRRSKQLLDSPEISSHRIKQSASYDLSPPRKLRHDRPDISPPQRRKRDSISPDLSPPRMRRHDSEELSSYQRRTNLHDLSPQSQRRGHDSDESPPRRRKLSPSSPNDRRMHRESKKQSEIKLPHGKKAGLHSASQLKTENELARKRQEMLFSKMDDNVSGRDAETVHRDKHGKRRDLKFEKLKQREEEQKKMEEDAKCMEWGRGVTQTKEAKQKREDEMYEMSKPLARYRDDKDLDDMLKNQDRAGDPMLAFIQKKQVSRDEKAGRKAKPRYKDQAPPNRFNIWPGYRWDGVDRSNGFEKRRFEMLSSKRATLEEAYKWSTEDM